MSEQKVFVGRERQLSMLDQFFEGALAGNGGVCFITGEAGQEKLSCLRSFFSGRRTSMLTWLLQ